MWATENSGSNGPAAPAGGMNDDTDLPSEKVGNISVDDRIWQKANIDDLDKSVANVKRGVHSIVDQALPDQGAYDRAGAEVNKDVILAKLLRKTARRLKHGGNDLTSFRNQNDMSKQDFQRQLRVVLQSRGPGIGRTSILVVGGRTLVQFHSLVQD